MTQLHLPNRINTGDYLPAVGYRDLAAIGALRDVFGRSTTGSDSAVSTTANVLGAKQSPYVFPPGSETLTISSSSANDTAAGTGARMVFVRGVTTNSQSLKAMTYEIAELNGQTAVTLTNQYYRILDLAILSAGSGGKAAGDICIGVGALTGGVPATTYYHIPTGARLMRQATTWVPVGWYGYVTNWWISNSGLNTGGVYGRLRAINRVVAGFQLMDRELRIKGGYIHEPLSFPSEIAAGTDVFIEAEASTSTVDASGGFETMMYTTTYKDAMQP